MRTHWLRYGDLSGFYFFYFALLGVLVPYASLWLDHLGLTPVQIGVVMGAFIGTKLIAPALWGHLSDQSGHKARWARLAAGLTLLFVSGWLLTTRFWPVLLVALAFSFFYHAMLPQVEAITLERLHDKGRYGRIRLWGSVGFIVAVMVAGAGLERGGIEQLPVWLTAAAALVFFITLRLRDEARPAHHEAEASMRALLRRPTVWALLATTFLVTASHGVYYNFYSLAWREAGYGESFISLLWAWAVAVEVGLFSLMHRLFARWSVETLMQVAIVLTALRWGLNMLWPTEVAVQLFAQALHAASYALFHGCAITLIDRIFTGPVQVRGQGLYAAISHGLGGGVGALLGGWLWHWGGGTLGYAVSLALALLALFIFRHGGFRQCDSCTP
ncbi:MFS transporter [Sulfurivirga sp.]|uniref:MFS transporter n=1 Tax=Sulfurivirga sp. TaxID=2614236 RepID=UPI0026000B66|nr:MFS transporter [Sulfurivirga sp.]